MRFFICTCLFLSVFQSVYSQSSLVSEERVKSLLSMADFYYTAENYDKALELGKQAMDMTGKIFGNNSYEYASSAFTLAQYYYSKGRHNSTISQTTANLCFKNAIKNLKINMNIINDSLMSGFDKLESVEKYELWQKVCPLYDRLFPCYVACCQNDSTISDLYNSVLFSKGITWRNYREATKGNWRMILKKLRTDDVAIEFISPVDLDVENITFYALILNSKDNAPHMVKLFDILQLQELLKKANSSFEKDHAIGKLIWGTLEEELKGYKNIYFSATHVFHNIPIEYLPIDEKSFYFDKYNFRRVTSTMELISNNRPEYKTAVLYGGLDYESDPHVHNDNGKTRSGLEPLPDTDVEVKDISKLLLNKGLKCDIYTGLQGTETSFKQLSNQSINILHLSTHGNYIRDHVSSKYIVAGALSNSYLALSGANKRLYDSSTDEKNDGIITALDISRMNFNSLDLVCLSACESALGAYSDDDGIIGLQKGFKMAGANTILMSINKVDDEATRIMMVEFYRNLMSGKTKHQSLTDAQHYLRSVESGKYDDPKYWASFIMLDGLN